VFHRSKKAIEALGGVLVNLAVGERMPPSAHP